MATLPTRRFRKVHERILLSRVFGAALGWLIVVALPAVLYWGPTTLFSPNSGQRTALIATSIAFFMSYVTIKNLLGGFPGGRTQGLVSTQVLTFYALIIMVTLLFRLEVSRALLLASGGIGLIWFQLDHLATRTYIRPKLAIVPGGLANLIAALPHADARELSELDLQGIRYDGVVADFRRLDAHTERFLTQCALDNIPVYHAKHAFESLTGRVKIDTMSENTLGALLPSPTYLMLKRMLDWLIVLATLPLTAPIALLTMAAIRLETPGPIFFTQTRIGQGNRPFKMYKFRSMVSSQVSVERFAEDADPRVTRVGRFLRQWRIDELPQFINVLKGDMSLIGPRPEQPGFVQDFNEQIPFYGYRHVVKPGITGWAQIRQGYAADKDATQIKIEHDFYYIKHCSMSLDFLIVLLTIKTMVSGFGAR